MKNLVIDVIFWGNFCPGGYPCTASQDVLDYISALKSHLDGVPQPLQTFAVQGFDAAVHYYGVSSINPGNWIVNPNPLGAYGPPGTSQTDENVIGGVVHAARAGSYGPSRNFAGNTFSTGMPGGTNHIGIVVTTGANACLDTPISQYQPIQSLFLSCVGFHAWASDGTLYGTVQWDKDRATLAHEIFEAMTDPLVNVPQTGWAGDVTPSSPPKPELADQCRTEYYPSSPGQTFFWTGSWSPNDNISGLAPITINAPYKSDNQAATACGTLIPEQHAPMAAAVEGGVVVLDYLGPDGHIRSVHWNAAGQAASLPSDLGQPSSTVLAVGKPSLVYNASAGGEYLFTRGSDGGLWMFHSGTWTQLGGMIFGDPSAVIWANGTLIDVFVLGIDDTLYYFGMSPTTLWGYSAVPNNNGTKFVTGPTVISRTANSLDLFAVGEDGQMKWMPLTTSGWGPVTTVSNDAQPYIGPVSAIVTPGTLHGMDVFGMGEQNGFFHGNWNPVSGWASWEGSAFGWFPPYPATLQGTPAVVSWGPGRLDVFAVDRQSQLWHWNKAPGTGWIPSDGQGSTLNRPPLVSGNVIGDPTVVSRGANELELFYRLGSGNVGHKILNGSTWGAQETVPINVW
jgi:hypothetical protein